MATSVYLATFAGVLRGTEQRILIKKAGTCQPILIGKHSLRFLETCCGFTIENPIPRMHVEEQKNAPPNIFGQVGYSANHEYLMQDARNNSADG